ncbi:tRNA (adenosine(37)-N6)-threonylcarbamoyltransferase complex ATPase subunit type 1 TsaE [Segetibacter sp.]|jgi:tRNA threonylcarbamoyladenosine biosynthesis protein TsaE|uniref:tRNA (adenosine(37)-N6)-threonylcarbamoyltransferase complex ATPase subunit type 1 TsaE n=1 Tax=Segetibacter sp. TaxID=2231182 RepID=UPI002604C70A|nr:tRNA (adenosine(37)-N6)-threonylcarbamoyltransferase complex ATPase subunit type 1 TsaE [Segetibacter sp.]MCW3079977.1 tsaE [Segetibacter sp.]
MQLTFTLSEIRQAAEKVFEIGKDRKVWAIHGEMGAGKTTFIHALCENLQISSAFGSPTYSIINEYKSEKVGQIYHMDWYRLKDEDEALQAGVEDCLFSGSFCMVEWSERAPALLPADCLHISVWIVDKQTRQLSLK